MLTIELNKSVSALVFIIFIKRRININVVIVSAVRAAIGSFGGAFKDVSAVELGTAVVEEAISRANIQADQVEELILECLICRAWPNVARQVSVHVTSR